MAWLAVLRAATSFLQEVAASMRERRLLKAGRAEALAEILSDATGQQDRRGRQGRSLVQHPSTGQLANRRDVPVHSPDPAAVKPS